MLGRLFLMVVFVALGWTTPASAGTISVSCAGVNDTAAVNAAINSYNAASGGSTLLFPSGICRLTGATNVLTNSGIIRGDGSSIIVSATANNTVFIVSSNSAVVFRDIEITQDVSVVKTDGAGIFLTSPGSTGNPNSRIENVTVNGMYYGITLDHTVGTVISNCYVTNSIAAGVVKVNITDEDRGDDTVTGSIIDTEVSNSSASAILQYAGGGLRIINNKILRHATGYRMVLSGSRDTSDLLIIGNSFENQTASSILLERGVEARRFGNVVITGNQFALSSNVLSIPEAAAGVNNDWVIGLAISGNVIQVNGPIALKLYGGQDVSITGNVFGGLNPSSTAAIALHPVYPVSSVIGPNQYSRFSTNVALNGNTTATVY